MKNLNTKFPHCLFACIITVFLTALHGLANDSVKVIENPASKDKFSIHFSVNPQFNPAFRYLPLGDSIDNMGNPGGRIRIIGVTGENANYWNASPAFIGVNLNWHPLSFLALHSNWKLRKIIDAWYDDPSFSNVPHSPKEIDINIPDYGILKINLPHNNSIKLGRFPIHWSSSSEYGLALSKSTPFHDGVHLFLQGTFFEYQFLVSSLNPWLSGTPSEDPEVFPEGSEEYFQRAFYRNHNDRNRSYVEMAKTLFAHRIKWKSPYFELGVSEISVLGGKAPSFRDGSPLALYHNHYNDGFSNIGFGFDVKVKLPKLQIFAESFIDEIKESDDGGKATQLGWMIGISHDFSLGTLALNHKLHIIQTDPYLYNSHRPLLKLTGRQVYRSNYIELNSNPFTDTYVLEYPLGYIGGSDRFDVRYSITSKLTTKLTLELLVNYLQQGEKNLLKLAWKQEGGESLSSPTGSPQRNWQNQLILSANWFKATVLNVGAGYEYIENIQHKSLKTQNKTQHHPWVFFGLKYQIKWAPETFPGVAKN